MRRLGKLTAKAVGSSQAASADVSELVEAV